MSQTMSVRGVGYNDPFWVLIPDSKMSGKVRRSRENFPILPNAFYCECATFPDFSQLIGVWIVLCHFYKSQKAHLS